MTEIQLTFRGVPGRDGRDGLVGPQGAPGPAGPFGPQGGEGPMGPRRNVGPQSESKHMLDKYTRLRTVRYIDNTGPPGELISDKICVRSRGVKRSAADVLRCAANKDE